MAIIKRIHPKMHKGKLNLTFCICFKLMHAVILIIPKLGDLCQYPSLISK